MARKPNTFIYLLCNSVFLHGETTISEAWRSFRPIKWGQKKETQWKKDKFDSLEGMDNFAIQMKKVCVKTGSSDQ